MADQEADQVAEAWRKLGLAANQAQEAKQEIVHGLQAEQDTTAAELKALREAIADVKETTEQLVAEMQLLRKQLAGKQDDEEQQLNRSQSPKASNRSRSPSVESDGNTSSDSVLQPTQSTQFNSPPLNAPQFPPYVHFRQYPMQFNQFYPPPPFMPHFQNNPNAGYPYQRPW